MFVKQKTQLHLRDLSAAQLATVASGVLPSLTPLRLMKLGGRFCKQLGLVCRNALDESAVFLNMLRPVARMPTQVRQSLSLQFKQQTASSKTETDMGLKMENMKKEHSAERIWKQRILQILDLGALPLYINVRSLHM